MESSVGGDKVAIFINRSSDKAMVADINLIHRGVRADGYRTIVFSPQMPVAAVDNYVGQDVAKLKEAIRKLSHLGKRDKLVIYFGGTKITAVCGTQGSAT